MDTVFFIASKVVWAAIRIESWLFLGLCLTVWGTWRNRPRLARRSAMVTLIGFLAIALLPLGDLLLRPLETRYDRGPLPDAITGIVVLGGAEETEIARYWNTPTFSDAAERLIAAAALARQHPEAMVLYTGGSGSLADLGQSVTIPAETTRETLLALGVPADRIILETASRNTAENAAFSRAIVNPGPDENWILVTSAFHMPRSVQSFRNAGWPAVIPYPVDYRSGPLLDSFDWEPAKQMQKMNTALKEYVGIFAYWLTGR